MPELYIPWLVVLAGAVILGLGIRMMLRSHRFEQRALRANGVVTQLRWSSAGGDGMAAFPVLRFELPDGRIVEAQAQQGSNPPPAQEGQPVVVLYDPDDPTIVRLQGWKGSAALPAGIVIVLGAGAMLLGTFVGVLFYLVRGLE